MNSSNGFKTKLGIAVFIIAAMLIIITACSSKVTDDKTITNTVKNNDTDIVLNIMVTDKMLANLTKEIVKDKHFVDYMFQDRNSGLTFNYSDDSLLNISNEDLFIYFGASYEPWANNFTDKLGKSKVGIINASRGIKLNMLSNEVKYGDITVKENPYYFLNLDDYKIALSNIKNAVEDKDPKNRDIYEKNFESAIKKIEPIQKSIKDLSDASKNIVILTCEDYMDYYLKYASLKQIKADMSELDKKQISDTATLQKLDDNLKNNNKIIFLYSDDNYLKANEDIIKKYNMTAVKWSLQESSFNCLNLIKKNTGELKKAVDSSGLKQ
ncbi:MAG: manganese transporter substrate-binding protein [Clostridiaceae bacterium]|nr:manganese transporter substrate-binding protein [Clostridiaceae bacterium]